MKVVYKIPRLKAQMQIEIALFKKKIFFTWYTYKHFI